jgi:sugar lactone lactonase YvrE
MVVASNGQLYAGNFGFDLDALYEGTLDGSQIRPTSLIRVDPDGTTHQAAADIAFPNGTVITEDGKTLVIAESLGGRLTAFDREPDGSLTNRREWASLPGVAPDGICLCEDNTIWVSNALGHECLRVAEGGQVLERVTTSMNCFACMLGDDDRRTLYMITAVESHGAKARSVRNGAIEKVRTTVPGAGLP